MALISSSSSWLPWALAAAIIAVVFHFLSRSSGITRDGKPLRKPPNTLPLVGNGLYFLQDRHKLLAWFVRCERLFGRETFELYVPSLPPGVVINDPQNLDFVFKNEGIFGKGAFMKKPLWDLFGHGIINSDGELWRVQRKAGLSFLSNKNLQVLTDVALPEYLAQAINSLKSTCDERREADLQAVFLEITSQLMGKMAYNMDMHADDKFTVAFDYASGATAERVQNPLWRLTEMFTGARMRESVAIVKAFGRRIVDKAVQDRASGPKSTTATAAAAAASDEVLDEISGSLIQSLLDSIGDKEMVADAALNYLSAGRDTTAQALTWAFHLLMQHRYVYAKVRREVQDLLESNRHRHQNQKQQQQTRSTTTAGGSTRRHHLPFDPTLFTPASLPYTHAVFNETLRLYPPIPVEIKQTLAPTTLPDGTFLPAGCVVLWCPWAMNRSQRTWGSSDDDDADDAHHFRPERWLLPTTTTSSSSPSSPPNNNNTINNNKSAAEFPVFNGGSRLCLGKTMAERVAVQVLAAVAWTFDFVPAYEGTERRSKSSLTLPMRGGLPVFVKVRNNNRRGMGRLGVDDDEYYDDVEEDGLLT